MASLGSLPPEIFNHIVGFMADDCEGTLASLAAVCRGFYKLVMPQLYHQVLDRHPALLHWAAQFDRAATAQRLIDAGAPVQAAMQCETLFLERSCAIPKATPREAYRRIQAHLERQEMVISTTYPSWQSIWFPIHFAAMSGSLEVIELLVEASPSATAATCHRPCDCLDIRLPVPDPDEVIPAFFTPLRLAACHGHSHVVRWLLKRGCGPVATLNRPGNSIDDREGTFTALHDAARLGQVDMIEFILDGGYQADVHVLDVWQFPPIWYAVYNNWDAVDMLVARGADIDDDTGFGYTPLIDACLSGKFELREDHAVVDLVGRGIRPIDICSWTHRAVTPAGRREPKLSSDEASRTWRPRHPGKWNDYYAERDGRLSLVTRLLRAGANPGQGHAGHPPPLVVAAANHLSGVVDQLIKHGASVNVADEDGVSPLAAVFAYSDTYCPFHPPLNYAAWQTEPFVAAGQSRSSFVRDGLDPHHGGCAELRACAEILLRNGADVNQADMNGNTPLSRLFTAPCFRRHLGHRLDQVLWITPADRTRVASLLLQHGANPRAIMSPVDKGVHHDERVPITEWLARRLPLTALQHAFWNAEFEACQLLLDGGLAPNDDEVSWMTRLVLEESKGITDPGTPESLEFIKRLPAEQRRASLRSPVCLALALRRGWLETAQESWDAGLQLCDFSEAEQIRVGDCAHPAPAHRDSCVDAGVLCLYGAAKWNAATILDGLLELGVRPIPPCALLHAVHNENDGILGTLVKHGGTVHIRDVETDSCPSPEYHPCWQHVDGCINPMKLAIHRNRTSAIKVMLEQSQDPTIKPWFRYFYLKEAYTLLNPSTLACLLEHPSMRFDEADITTKVDHPFVDLVPHVDLPLAHLVRHVDRICAAPHADHLPDYGPKLRMDHVAAWMACVAAFAREGVDLAMRDRLGRSALDYLGEHLAYSGRDRFRNYLASELRSLGGENREDRLQDAGACWEALKVFGIGEGCDKEEEDEASAVMQPPAATGLL